MEKKGNHTMTLYNISRPVFAESTIMKTPRLYNNKIIFSIVFFLTILNGVLYARDVNVIPTHVDTSVGTRMWNDPQGWLDGTIPTSNDAVYIPNGSIITLADTSYCTSITIATGGRLSFSSFVLRANGNFTNDGIVLPGTGTLIMDGISAQTIGGSAQFSLTNLIIANTSAEVAIATGFNLSGTMTVNAGAVVRPGASVTWNPGEGAQGTLTGSGKVIVTRVTNPATFTSQYTFSTFVLSGLTVEYDGSATQQISGGITYGNLTLTTTADNVTASSNFNVSGTFTIGQDVVFVPTTSTIINNAAAAGTITGQGMVLVSNVSTTNKDFDSQYKFLTYSLSGLTVNYTGNGMSLSNHTYGNVDINGSITGSGTATVSGIFTVNNIFTPTSGGLTFIGNGSFQYFGGGNGLNFRDVTIQTGASVTTTTDFNLYGKLTVEAGASFIASDGTAFVYSDDEDDDIINDGSLTFKKISIVGGSVSTSSNFAVADSFVVRDDTSDFVSFFPSDITLSGNMDGVGALRFSTLTLGANITGGIYFEIWDTLNLGTHNLTMRDTVMISLYLENGNKPAVLTGTGDIFGYIDRPIASGVLNVPLQLGNTLTTITFSELGNLENVIVGTFPNAPAGDPSAVKRDFFIERFPSSATGFNAKLQFHYKDSELNGHDESTLVFERNNGSAFEEKGATGRDVVNNWVSLDSVNAFSEWALTSPTRDTLTVTGIIADNKEYDGTTTATINTAGAVLVGVNGSDDVTLNVSGAVGTFDDRNAGTGKTVHISGLTISGADTANYILVQPDTLADVTIKYVRASVTIQTKVYDASNSATIETRSLYDTIPGDDVACIGGTALFDDKNVGTPKNVMITGLSLSGSDSANYSVNSDTTALGTIVQDTLIITGAVATNKTYDGTTDATVDFSLAVLETPFAGDDVGFDYSSMTAEFDTKNAGTVKTVTVSGIVLGGLESGDYYLVQPQLTADIVPTTVTVSGITAKNKVFDKTTTAALLTNSLVLNGKIDSDNVFVNSAGASGQFSDSSPGDGKTVTISGLFIDGPDTANYSLDTSAITTTADIKPEAIVAAAVDSGAWNTASTWEVGSVPIPANPIRVQSGKTVFMDVSATVDTTLIVDGTLYINTNLIVGGGSFTLSPDATLGIGSNNGIYKTGNIGNIRTTGTRLFDTTANYLYTGPSTQVTGGGLPSTIKNYSIFSGGRVIQSGDIKVSGILRISSGSTLEAGNTKVTVLDNIYNDGAYKSNGGPSEGNPGGVITFAGTTTLFGDGQYNFPYVVIDSGATLNDNGDTIKVAGDWTNDGTFLTTGYSRFVADNNGDGHDIGASNFNELIVGSGDWFMSGNLSVNGDFSISGGTLEVDDDTLQLAGNWTSGNDDFFAGTSTVQFSNARTITGSGGLGFYNLVIDGAVTSGRDFRVEGELTLHNNLLMSPYTLTLGKLAGTKNPLAGARYDVIGKTMREMSDISTGVEYSFNNQYTNITFDSGLPSTDVTVELIKDTTASPMDGGTPVQSLYLMKADTLQLLTPISGYSASMMLHYDDSLNGNSQENLTLWRYDAGERKFVNKGRRGDVDTVHKAVSLTNVQLFSPWTLATPSGHIHRWIGIASDDWTSPSNWYNGVPESPTEDSVIVPGGVPFSPILPNNSSVEMAALNIIEGGLVTSGLNSSITALRNVLIDSSSQIYAGETTLDIQADSLLIQGTFVGATSSVKIQGTTVILGNGQYNSGSIRTVFVGGLVINGGAYIGTVASDTIYQHLTILSGAYTASVNPVYISGNFILNSGGTFNHNGGTVVFIDSSSIGGTQIPLFGAIVIAGTAVANSDTVDVENSWRDIGTFYPNGNVVRFVGNATILAGNGDPNFHIIVIDNVLTLSTSITMTGDFINNGVFNRGNSTVTFAGVSSIGGTQASIFQNIVIQGTLNAPSGNLYINKNFTDNGTFNSNNGTLVLTGSTDVRGTVPVPLNNLFLQSGSEIVIFSDTTVISGNIETESDDYSFDGGRKVVIFDNNTTISSPGEYSFGKIVITGSLTASPDVTFFVYYNWNNLGTFVADSSTVEFGSEGEPHVFNPGLSEYFNIIHDGLEDSLVIYSNNLTINGNLENLNGDFFANGFDVTVAGYTIIQSSFYYAGSGTQTFNGGLHLIDDPDHVGGDLIGSTGIIIVHDTLFVDKNCILKAPSTTMYVSGDWVSNNGDFDANGGTININGDTTQTLNGKTNFVFFNLSLTNTSPNTVHSTSFTVDSIFYVSSTTHFMPDTNAVIGGTGVLTGTGTVDVTKLSLPASFLDQYTIAHLDVDSLTVDYVGTGQSVSNLTYGSPGSGGLRISGSISTGTHSAAIGGFFDVTGTFTPSGGTITLNNGSTISNSPGTLTFVNLNIADSASATSHRSFGVTDTMSVGPSASALFTPDSNNVVDGSATGTLNGYGTAKVTRLATTADFISQYTFSTKDLSNLTVDYAGTGNQNVNNFANDSISYKHLYLSGSGTKTIGAGKLLIYGDFVIADSVVADALSNSSEVSFEGDTQAVPKIDYFSLSLSGNGDKTFSTGTTRVAGNFTVSGNGNPVFTPTTIIEFNGAGSQDVAPLQYNGLVLSNTGQKVFQNGTTGIGGSFTVSDSTPVDFVTNASILSYNDDSAQTIFPFAYYSLTLDNAGVKTVSSDTTSIAGFLTIQGNATIDALTNQSTIMFNGDAVQPIPPISYYNLIVNKSSGSSFLSDSTYIWGTLTLQSGSFTTFPAGQRSLKGAAAGGNYLFVNNDLVLTDTCEFYGNESNIVLRGNWINADSQFIPGNSTVIFEGNSRGLRKIATANDAKIQGTGTLYFNSLIVNDSLGSEIDLEVNDSLILNQSLNMGGKTLTLGPGAQTFNPNPGGEYDVFGIVKRHQADIVTGTLYSFNNEYTTVVFDSGAPTTDVTVELSTGVAESLNTYESITRLYDIGADGNFASTLRLHYRENELNGNPEDSLVLWKKEGNDGFEEQGRTGDVDTINKSVSLSNINEFSLWTLGKKFVTHTHIWAGLTSDEWYPATNWENNNPPDGDPTDIIIMPDSTTVSFIAKLPAGDTVTAHTFSMERDSRLYGRDSTVLLISHYWNIDTGGTFFAGLGDRYSVDSNFTNAGDVHAMAGEFSVGGDWKNFGTFNADSGSTLTMRGAEQALRNGGAQFYNLTHDGSGTLTVEDVLTVNGDLVNSTGNFSVNNHSVNITGDLILQQDSTFLQASVVHVASLNVAGGTLINQGGTLSFTDVNIDSGIVEASNSVIFVSGNWNLTGGDIIFSDSRVSFYGYGGLHTIRSGGKPFQTLVHSQADSLSDTLRLMDNLEATLAFTNSSGVFETNGHSIVAGSLPPSAGKPTRGGNTADNVQGEIYGFSMGNGIFIGSSGNLDVSDVNITGGEVIAPSGGFYVRGTWNYSGGIFTPGNGTVTLQKDQDTQYVYCSGMEFNKLTHDGNGTVKLANGNLVVLSDFFNVKGAFNANGYSVTTSGYMFIQGGEYNAGSGTQNFDGGLILTTGKFTGGSGKIFVHGPFTVNDTLVVPTDTLSIYGSITFNGVFIPNGGTVLFTGGSTHAISNGFVSNESKDGIIAGKGRTFSGGGPVMSLNNLIIDDSTSTQVDMEVSGELRLNNNLKLNSTTLTMRDTAYTVNPLPGSEYDVIGTVTRRNAELSTGTEYTFNNQYTIVRFDSGAPSTDVSITVVPGYDVTLGNDESVLRNYSIDGSGTFSATLRLHYRDSELNGNSSDSLTLWRAEENDPYEDLGRTGGIDTVNKSVALSGVSQFSNWTLGNAALVVVSHIHTWAGVTSTDWYTATNWLNDNPPDHDSTDVIVMPDSTTVSFIALLPVRDSVDAHTFTIEQNGRLYGTDSAIIFTSHDWNIDTGGTFFAGIDNRYFVHGNFNNSGEFYAGNSTLLLRGDFNNEHEFEPDSGNTVIFTGGNQSIKNARSKLYTIVHEGNGTLSLTDSTWVDGSLVNNSGNIECSSYSLIVLGKVTMNADSLLFHHDINLTGGLAIEGGTVVNYQGYLNAGDVTIDSGKLSLENSGVRVSGNWTVNGGEFTSVNSYVVFNGMGKTQYVQPGGKPFTYFYHTGSDTVVLTGDLTVNQLLNFDNGYLATNQYNLTMPPLPPPPQKDEKKAASNQEGESAGMVLRSGAVIGSSGSMDITDVVLHGGEFIAPTGQFSVSGNWMGLGGAFTAGTGTVTFNKTWGTQTITGGGNSFYNITHAGTATLQAMDSLSASGGLTNNTGVFDANNRVVSFSGNTTVNGGSYLAKSATQTFAGLNIAGGSFIGDSGKVIVQGTLTIGDTLVAPFDTLTIGGDFVNNGVFQWNTGSTVLFNGTSWQSIGGTSSLDFYHVVVNGTQGDSLKGNTTIYGNLNILGGNFVVGANWLTLKKPILGTTTNFVADGTSSITVAGAPDSVNIPSNVSALKNFFVKNTVGTTLQANLTVLDSMKLFSGTFHDNGYTLSIQGNIVNNAVHFGTGKILISDGANQHTVGSDGTGVFGNLELNDTLGAQVAGTLRITGTLSIYDGLLRSVNDTIILDTNARLNESPGKLVYGKIKTTRTIFLTSQDFGGLGIRFVPLIGNPLGSATVLRVNDTILTNDSGLAGVKRYFRVSSQFDSPMDSVIFNYDESERNSLDAATLVIHHYPFGGSGWLKEGTTAAYDGEIIQQTVGEMDGYWSAFAFAPYVPKPSIVFLDPSIQFDTLVIGESSTKSLRIKNTGDAVLMVNSVFASSSSIAVHAPTFANVQPESTATFSLTFTPTVAVQATGSIYVNHNDEVSGPLDTIPVRLRAYERKHAGDANNDGSVTISDVIEIGLSYHLTGSTSPSFRSDGVALLPITGWEANPNSARADCNGDGIVDTGDVALILDSILSVSPEARIIMVTQLQAMAQSLPEGQFKNDLLAFIHSSYRDVLELPKEWRVEQNYPNPFNGTTIIKFAVPQKSASVRIVIYDALGKTVRTYERSNIEQGWFQIPWDAVDDAGRNVTSGVYFYRMEYPFLSPVNKILYTK